MKIRFYAHASFRLEADGLAVITDSYTPGPENSGFDPIDEPADIVIMSSATDSFHSDPSHVRGDPVVVNALELAPEGAEVRGLQIRPFPAMESTTLDFGQDPDANALYHFTLGGLRILHMGDIGNPVPQQHLDALAGNVDVLFALTGAHATIALDDLDAAIDASGPRLVIPMHYYNNHQRTDNRAHSPSTTLQIGTITPTRILTVVGDLAQTPLARRAGLLTITSA